MMKIGLEDLMACGDVNMCPVSTDDERLKSCEKIISESQGRNHFRNLFLKMKSSLNVLFLNIRFYENDVSVSPRSG